jgi:hypothetical protein
MTKDSEDGDNKSLRFGATSMQGWRKSQEDTHIAHLNVGFDKSDRPRDV